MSSSIWERFVSPFKGTSQPTDGSCFWSVDIHSHLLPGLDDGVKDTEQALACLTQLSEWGIQKIITTPHVSGDWYPNSSDSIRQMRATLQSLIDEHQLPLSIDVAAEYLIDDFFFDLLQADDLLTFGDKRYLLIEAGWAWGPNNFLDLIFRIQTQGYTPILAHPERYKYYHDDKRILHQLHKNDCLFQLNWMSLVGRYGADIQKQARYLLQEDLIDFIGSDLHHPRDLKDMARLFSSDDIKLLQQQTLLNDTLL
ncbi:tyrosine-protein phosphatase [Spirosoma profusum]|uniref:tyrosine-protein phosphatase n=1 Tax=Spirosoma profusum TaxID=2771354 RepID=UPI001CC24529|nr:CpsB/CapC family capsule biosynthesis tyrosine phosphatase [Spirosoma profusum]